MPVVAPKKHTSVHGAAHAVTTRARVLGVLAGGLFVCCTHRDRPYRASSAAAWSGAAGGRGHPAPQLQTKKRAAHAAATRSARHATRNAANTQRAARSAHMQHATCNVPHRLHRTTETSRNVAQLPIYAHHAAWDERCDRTDRACVLGAERAGGPPCTTECATAARAVKLASGLPRTPYNVRRATCNKAMKRSHPPCSIRHAHWPCARGASTRPWAGHRAPHRQTPTRAAAAFRRSGAPPCRMSSRLDPHLHRHVTAWCGGPSKPHGIQSRSEFAPATAATARNPDKDPWARSRMTTALVGTVVLQINREPAPHGRWKQKGIGIRPILLCLYLKPFDVFEKNGKKNEQARSTLRIYFQC